MLTVPSDPSTCQLRRKITSMSATCHSHGRQGGGHRRETYNRRSERRWEGSGKRTVCTGKGGASLGGSAKAKQQIGQCILRTACGKRPMHGMKLDIIDRKHQGLIFPAWRLVFPMTPERIILPEKPWQSEKSEEILGRVFTLDPYPQCS